MHTVFESILCAQTKPLGRSYSGCVAQEALVAVKLIAATSDEVPANSQFSCLEGDVGAKSEEALINAFLVARIVGRQRTEAA